jgi:hypothetical protein
MQSRIDRLEGLVLSLMSGNSNNVSPRNRDGRSSSSGAAYSESRDGDAEHDDDAMEEEEHEYQGGGEREKDVEEDVEEVRNALGIMKVHGGKSFYRGETHWAALLLEVRLQQPPPPPPFPASEMDSC